MQCIKIYLILLLYPALVWLVDPLSFNENNHVTRLKLIEPSCTSSQLDGHVIQKFSSQTKNDPVQVSL